MTPMGPSNWTPHWDLRREDAVEMTMSEFKDLVKDVGLETKDLKFDVMSNVRARDPNRWDPKFDVMSNVRARVKLRPIRAGGTSPRSGPRSHALAGRPPRAADVHAL